MQLYLGPGTLFFQSKFALRWNFERSDWLVKSLNQSEGSKFQRSVNLLGKNAYRIGPRT